MSSEDSFSQSQTVMELYFLICKFLEDGPCQNAFKALEQELATFGLLPPAVNPNGVRCSNTFADMSKKYPNIMKDTLLRICEKLRDTRRSNDPPGMLDVGSLLCAGRYSLLRTTPTPPKLPLHRIMCRRHGRVIPNPAGCQNQINFIRSLDARQLSGSVTRRDLVWPKLYNRMQLLNQTVGHIAGVYCVLFDETGKFIFTGADDLLVKVWSTVSGRLLATLRGASSEITDIAINPENTMLAAGSLDRTCYVWCLQSSGLIAQLPGNTGMITAVNFCPKTCHNVRYLACTSTFGCVAFWIYKHEPIGKDTIFNEQPIIFNEKMRPGVAQMICSSFSRGGVFLAAGSADHNVRVYLNTCAGGPQRIMEEEAHTDRVDSIQWANKGLRFVSGSKDGTALIWRYSHQRWQYLKLDLTVTLPNDVNGESAEDRQKPRVSMVCWDKSDNWIVTAGRDAALKVWNSENGELLRVLRNHRHDVFVLEPHPFDEGILLSAGHDGLMCIWDIRSGTCLLQYQNLIEGRGHGLFYDAKWSPDGTLIAATDSNGHILLFGFGAASDCFKELPKQLFFNTDYWPLTRDERGVLDEATGEPPHMMAAPFLVDLDGTPYPPKFQRLVPGREFQDLLSMEVLPGGLESGIAGRGAAYFPSAELASSRGNTPNAWHTRMLLPTLSSSVIKQIVETIEVNADSEEHEYKRESCRAAVPVQRQTSVKTKIRKRRTPATYKTRAAATETSSEFVNPDSIEQLSNSSHRGSSSNSSDENVSNFSDCSSSSEYSDWIADQGVSLEPPTRARRRRPPERLSLSPANTRTRAKESIPDVADEPHSSSASDEEQDPLKPEKIKEVPVEYLPPKWLSEVMPRKAPYYPQMGDHVIFFIEGYKIYLEVVRRKQVYKPSTRDIFSNLNDPIHVQVIGIKYEIRPPRLCCLRLAVINEDGSMNNQFFNIKYHDVPDVIDFLVLKQTYDIAIKRRWEPGDRFRCIIDDSWWLGSVIGTRSDKMYEDSPFLSLITKWDNGEDEPMSPWDMEPVDPNRMPSEPGGCIDVQPEEAQALLYTPGPDEWPEGRDAACERILSGLNIVMTLSVAEPFCAPVDLNLYPSYAMYVEYPVDLSTIKARLDNRFYRRLTGVQFDVRYLATNAEKFNDVHSQIVKQARIVTELCLRIIKKVKEMSDLDVMALYHHLMDDYRSSSDDENEEGNERGSIALNSAPEYANWRGDCERLLRELSSLPDSAPFRQPVDLLELPDYHQVVTTPMDLSTVREELMAGNFHSPNDFCEAVNLIFSNSRKYNTNKKSRVHGMAARLSKLFDARIKKLEHEWKGSRRRKIQEATQKRKLLGPKPGPSRVHDVDDPLKCLDNRISFGIGADAQPSTSRVALARSWSSDSEEDRYLATLRYNKNSSPDATITTDSVKASQQDPSLGNGLISESSTDNGEYHILQRSDEPNNIVINGHSYIKEMHESRQVKVIKILPVVKGPDEGCSSKTVVPLKLQTENEDVVYDQTSSPEQDYERFESNNRKYDEVDDVDEQDSNSSLPSNDSSYNKPVRRRLRGTTVKNNKTNNRHKRPQHSSDENSDSNASFISDARVPSSSDSSDASSDSESSSEASTKRRSTRLRQRSCRTSARRNRRRRSNTELSEEDSPPRSRRRRGNGDGDSDDDFHPKSKRRRKGSSGSESSTWMDSELDQKRGRRRSKRQVKRPAQSSSSENNDDESEEDIDEVITAVSSRGRVRKITEKARAALGRRKK